MKITAAMRKAINGWIRGQHYGAAPLAEVGLRGAKWEPNAINWGEDDDLGDLCKLADLKAIDDCEAHPGMALLDIYLTAGTKWDRELVTNVYVFIVNGEVVKVTDNDRMVSALEREHFGFNLAW